MFFGLPIFLISLVMLAAVSPRDRWWCVSLVGLLSWSPIIATGLMEIYTKVLHYELNREVAQSIGILAGYLGIVLWPFMLGSLIWILALFVRGLWRFWQRHR
jgi:hypothetical protein